MSTRRGSVYKKHSTYGQNNHRLTLTILKRSHGGKTHINRHTKKSPTRQATSQLPPPTPPPRPSTRPRISSLPLHSPGLFFPFNTTPIVIVFLAQTQAKTPAAYITERNRHSVTRCDPMRLNERRSYNGDRVFSYLAFVSFTAVQKRWKNTFSLILQY